VYTHALIAVADYITRVPHGSVSIVAHFPGTEIMYAEKVELDGDTVVLTSNTYKFCTMFPTSNLRMITAK
jgi:hypothetical protein